MDLTIENKANESEYSIYNYFKNHIPQLITIVSLIIAGLSFFCNMLNYYNESKVLYYWGWNPQLVEINVTNKVFNIIIALVFNLAIVVLQHNILNAFRHYYSFTKKLYISNKIVSILKKKCSEISESSKQINNHSRFEINNEIESVSNDIKNTKKDSQSIKRSIVKLFVLELVFCIVFGIILVLLLLSPVYDNKFTFFTRIGVSLLYLLFIIVITWRTAYILEFSQTKREVKLAGDNIDALGAIYDEIDEQKNMIDGNILDDTNKLKKVFSNKNIKTVILSQVIAIVFLFIIMLGTVNFAQSFKKDFQVCSYEDNQYVIIYRDDKNIYLDRISINTNNTAIIYTTDHRIEKVDEMQFVDYHFSDLSIKRLESEAK